MEKDAVSAGVSKIGGLFSSAEVRILICYILSAIGEPVPGRLLADTLHYEGIANYFEVGDSIASLCKSGQLESYNEAEDTYIITENGKDVAETLKTSLSMTVKERAYNAAIKMFSRFKNTKETDIKISKENGNTYVTCSTVDNNIPFMSIKLLVTDEEQALTIKENFLENPSAIYSTIVEMFTTKKSPKDKDK